MRRAFAIVYFLLIAVEISCRGLPRPSSRPAAHQVPIGQLVFHCDFELSADHPLVRDLNAERDDISQTLDLPTSNQQIDVYLFRDADAYGPFIELM